MQALVAKEQLSQYNKMDLNKARRDKLIIDNFPLVKYVTRKIMNHLPSTVDQEDLIQSGTLGLMDAAEKFDEKRSVKFKTYAYYRIKGSIMDYLRQEDWVPRSVREKDKQIKETYNSLEQKLKRTPRSEEVADALSISCSKLDKILAKTSLCSIRYSEDFNYGKDTYQGKKVTLTFQDHQACEPLDVLELEEEQRELEHVIAELQYREKLIIALYYYEGMRLREIAEVIKVSESRISQLLHEALLSIRAKVYKSETVKNLN